MLADLVEKLVNLGRSTESAHVRVHPLVRDRAFWVKGREVEEITLPPPVRDPRIDSLADLVAFLAEEHRAKAPEVYVSPSSVVAFINHADRRERAAMPLEVAEQFKTLQGMSGLQSFTPADAIRFLRFKLPDGHVGPVIQALRQVDFSRGGTGTNSTEHGRETLGRSVEAKVQQADKIPETFKVTTRVFSNSGLGSIAEEVTVGVHLNVGAEQVEFAVLPDQCERAMRSAVDRVADLTRTVSKGGFPVFAGDPGRQVEWAPRHEHC